MLQHKSVDLDFKPAKTLIIGHKGRMGSMLLKEAQNHGLLAIGQDQPLNPSDLKAASSEIDLAIFCVPALVLEEVLAKVCPFLPETCIVADITSVKVLPLKLMEQCWPNQVVGTHPLFGPAFNRDDNLTVAITKGSKTTAETQAKIEAFFTTLGFKILRCDPKEHDLAMANIQNLNFITNLAYFALLAGHKELLPFITPSFKRRLKASEKMLTEDAEMFTGLFESNLKSHEVVRKFSKLLNLAAAGDIEILCKKAQWWFKESN